MSSIYIIFLIINLNYILLSSSDEKCKLVFFNTRDTLHYKCISGNNVILECRVDDIKSSGYQRCDIITKRNSANRLCVRRVLSLDRIVSVNCSY